MQFVESPEYSMFTRIVFDTAPTVSKKEKMWFISYFWLVNIHLWIGFIGSYTQAFVPARLLGCINRQDDEGENLKFEFELVSCDYLSILFKSICWINEEYGRVALGSKHKHLILWIFYSMACYSIILCC